MGQGISSGDGYLTVEFRDVSATPVAPYTHNCSYLLYNLPLSSKGDDISVCFDLALYTNTSNNSAYMVDTTYIAAIQRENEDYVLAEDGEYIFA
jgi:hypothetical protein